MHADLEAVMSINNDLNHLNE